MTDNCKKCWGNKYYEGKECRECLGTGSEKERLRIIKPIKMKLKPCDCKDITTAEKLNEQGISHNNQSIVLAPNSVVLTMGHTIIKIPMARFKMFAEWYLKKQEISNKKKTVQYS